MKQGRTKGPTKQRGALESHVLTKLGGAGGREAPRCQATTKSTGEQCERPARKGHRVCGAHGAGYAKREQNGTRKNPKTAPITHGLTAQPETLEEWAGLHKDLQARIEHYRRHPLELRNLDELLARLWAVADIVGESRPDISIGEHGESPPPLLDVLKGVATALEKVARIEWKIRQSPAPTLTVHQARRLVKGVVELLHEFVSPDALDECIRRLTRLGEQLVGGSDPRGAPAREQAHGSAA